MMETKANKAMRWTDLPAIDLHQGNMRRTGFRMDEALLTMNFIKPTAQRWEPHSHPFDQTVLTVEGTQILEIEGKAMACPAGSIVRVPANAKHTGWPEGGKPVLNIDIFAPPRADYLFLTDYQKEFAADNAAKKPTGTAYHQLPQRSKFAGEMMKDTKDVLYRWSDLPTADIDGGSMKRAGFRADNCLLTFNWIDPGMKRAEPHSHPFDQVILVVKGRLMVEIDGEAMECGPQSIVRVPANAKHTGWALGDEPILNIDVFAPARKDYLHLVGYQKDYRR
jgi:quercetin dioxygenase-like cupin family protein